MMPRHRPAQLDLTQYDTSPSDNNAAIETELTKPLSARGRKLFFDGGSPAGLKMLTIVQDDGTTQDVHLGRAVQIKEEKASRRRPEKRASNILRMFNEMDFGGKGFLTEEDQIQIYKMKVPIVSISTLCLSKYILLRVPNCQTQELRPSEESSGRKYRNRCQGE
jgi:hypothetical protein